MKKQQLLSDLIEAIHNVCPELHDVEKPYYIVNSKQFDCEIIRPGDILPVGNITIRSISNDIHLEHVLQAIDSKSYAEYAMMTTGRIFQFSNQETRIHYDLTKSFEDQSVETLQFLWDIIVSPITNNE